MAAAPLPPIAPVPAPESLRLSQGARIVDTFISPAKTFADIRRSAQWWLPFLLMTLVGWGLVYIAEQKIGLQKLVANDLHARPKAEEQFEKAPPERQQQQIKLTGTIYYIAIPVFTLVIWLVMAALQFATFKFGANADLSYSRALAVVVYAGLPMVLRNLLGIISVLAGVSPDGFTLNNPIASNPGYFMDAANSPFWYFIASQFDIFLFWTLALTAIGFATAGKVKMGTSFAIVIGWWVVITLAFSALFS
jgi:Yip1 domain